MVRRPAAVFCRGAEPEASERQGTRSRPLAMPMGGRTDRAPRTFGAAVQGQAPLVGATLLFAMSRVPSVYLETTVISYLTGRPSRNLRVVAHQEITVDWWTRRRVRFELYVSRLVIDEAAAGDAEAAARRLAALNGIPRLELTESTSALAANLVTEAAIPREAIEDALHVAVAATHGMDYLLTWNCRHIANATMRNRIADVCATCGFEAQVICTPEELLED